MISGYLLSCNCSFHESATYIKCVCMFILRPESAEGYLSPCPSVSGNGENWELESTTSSAASNTEYTGGQMTKHFTARHGRFWSSYRPLNDHLHTDSDSFLSFLQGQSCIRSPVLSQINTSSRMHWLTAALQGESMRGRRTRSWR